LGTWARKGSLGLCLGFLAGLVAREDAERLEVACCRGDTLLGL
jgi:hypothetical protein